MCAAKILQNIPSKVKNVNMFTCHKASGTALTDKSREKKEFINSTMLPQHSSQQSFMIKSYRNLWNGGLSHFELLLWAGWLLPFPPHLTESGLRFHDVRVEREVSHPPPLQKGKVVNEAITPQLLWTREDLVYVYAIKPPPDTLLTPLQLIPRNRVKGEIFLYLDVRNR